MLRWGPRASVAYPWLLSATAKRLAEQRDPTMYYADPVGLSTLELLIPPAGVSSVPAIRETRRRSVRFHSSTRAITQHQLHKLSA
jgi:hypothetical protein